MEKIVMIDKAGNKNIATLHISCGKCFYGDFSASASNGENLGVCRERPPVSLVVPRMSIVGQMEFVISTAFPVVRSDMWCCNYAEIQILSDEAG
jgi:hypothetical protein